MWRRRHLDLGCVKFVLPVCVEGREHVFVKAGCLFGLHLRGPCRLDRIGQDVDFLHKVSHETSIKEGVFENLMRERLDGRGSNVSIRVDELYMVRHACSCVLPDCANFILLSMAKKANAVVWDESSKIDGTSARKLYPTTKGNSVSFPRYEGPYICLSS